MAGELLIALGVVFAVNLLPAFGPPTWAVLVFFSLQFDLPAVPLVLGDVVIDALTSPLGMGLQLAMLVALGFLLGGLRPSRSVWGSPDEGVRPGS